MMRKRPIVKRHTEPDRKKRVILAVVLLLLMCAFGTAAWAVWSREDPQMRKVRDMLGAMEDVPWDQRRERFQAVRQEMEKLTDEQRDELRDERRGRWEAREEQQLKDFFAMSPEEQTAELDRRIDRMQQWRERREKEGNRRGRDGRRGRTRSRAQSFGVDASGSSASVGRNSRRLDRGSSDSRSRRDVYRRMMVQRMRQRGI